MNCGMTKEQWIKFGGKIMEDRDKRIKKAKKWKFDTVATHGLYDANQAFSLNSGSIMEPVYMSTAEAYQNSAHMEASLAYEMPTWCYSRIANPTNMYLEETAALLETYGSDIIASCCATSSGMSSIRTATDPFLVKDKSFRAPNIVSSAKLYGGTFQQFQVRRWEEQGIEVRWVRDTMNFDEWAAKVDEETRFVYGEFPSNPAVAIFDIEKIAGLAHKFNAPLIVDATCASPALTRPIVLGADIAIQSATKVIGSSGSSIAGFLTARKNLVSKVGPAEMKEDFAFWVKLWPFRDNGPSLSPMSAYLILNEMRSLRMRVERMSDTALAVSRFLEQHPRIDRVYYPGLESYPAHSIAKKYMKLADTENNKYGFMLAAEIKEDEPGRSKNSRKFYDSLQMIWRATDLGRVKTVATLNAISTHLQQGEEGRTLAEIKPSTCRIAVGIEDASDIIADLEQALARI